MIDLRATVIPKSDQLNADDLIAGPLTITITAVEVPGGEQPVTIHYAGGDGRPYRPGKSMRRALINLWGPDGEVYIGRSLTLYRDEKVQFGGETVGGIRISHASHMDKPVTMALTATRGKRKPFTIQPLREAPRQPSEKVLLGVKAILARIEAGEDIDSDPAASKQRDWLYENWPHLAAQINAAIDAAQQKVEA
jgi:hypothetical protein